MRSSSNPRINRRRGIPVQMAPQNICNVNPYICRMTPTDIKLTSKLNPSIGQLSWEPYPRGCKCCSKNIEIPNGRTTDCFDRAKYCQLNQHCIVQHDNCQCLDHRRSTATLGNPNMKDGDARNHQDSLPDAFEFKKKRKKLNIFKKKDKNKQQIEDEQVRLLRESQARDDFVTACIGGLLVTPCHSTGSLEDDVEEKEQANFFIQCKYGEKDCRRRRSPDVACQCRACPHLDTQDSKTRCKRTPQAKTICYCKAYPTSENDPCNDCLAVKKGISPQQLKSGVPVKSTCSPQYHQQGQVPPECYSSTVRGPLPLCTCDMHLEMAHLHNSNQSGSNLQRESTVELIQKLLIQQAQQGINMANALNGRNQYCLMSANNQHAGNVCDCVNDATTCPQVGLMPTFGLEPVRAANMDARCPNMSFISPPGKSMEKQITSAGCWENGHLCIPKVAIPSMGDPEKSKFVIPMSFDTQAQFNEECPEQETPNVARKENCRMFELKRSKEHRKAGRNRDRLRDDMRQERSELRPSNSVQKLESLPRAPLQEKGHRNLLESSSNLAQRRHSRINSSKRASKHIKRLTLDEIEEKFEDYEKRLIEALETVKNRFKQMSENENSDSAKTSTGDNQTLTYAGIECLLKHIDCMRKELKRVGREDIQ